MYSEIQLPRLSIGSCPSNIGLNQNRVKDWFDIWIALLNVCVLSPGNWYNFKWWFCFHFSERADTFLLKGGEVTSPCLALKILFLITSTLFHHHDTWALPISPQSISVISYSPSRWLGFMVEHYLVSPSCHISAQTFTYTISSPAFTALDISLFVKL